MIGLRCSLRQKSLGVQAVSGSIALFAQYSFAQLQAVEPTQFETFVSASTVIVEEERLIGSIGSVDSTVEVSFVRARESWGSPPSTMSGIMIRLRSNASSDVVYLDADQTNDLALQLYLISTSLSDVTNATHSRSTEFLTGTHMRGSQNCWFGYENQQRILCPGYKLVEGFLTVSVRVNGGATEYHMEPAHLEQLARSFQDAVAVFEDPEASLAAPIDSPSNQTNSVAPQMVNHPQSRETNNLPPREKQASTAIGAVDSEQKQESKVKLFLLMASGLLLALLFARLVVRRK